MNKKLERKYTWKHVAVATVLFVIAGAINLIPRHSELTTSCTPGSTSGSKQTANITSIGWPLTYAKGYEATSICLVVKNGKYVSSAASQPKEELNVGALIFNEVLIVLVVGAALTLIGMRKGKK
jgi:hypothetical protein